ncbi:MAG: hypothetical protein L7F77_14140 [Candidatus Magnetominusculus sp. LBB02]|nr:hypothetical protein [Candidatus Magnetominusculus sp. LBB02]
MTLCLRLAVFIVASTVEFSPATVLAAKCKNQFYTISLKDSYLNKKYKVRAFFLYQDNYIYGIPKMPKGWFYDFPDEHGMESFIIGTAVTDKEAVDIGYFKDFLTYVITEFEPERKPDFSMILICNKPDGQAEIIKLRTKDFKIKIIHKCLRMY